MHPMKKTGTQNIRQTFLEFFQKKQHTLISSSSLIPANDPSLLFTNAGMNQFKAFFLGTEKSPYPCAVTAQRCVRAGGKHNDLENVGYTARHHTFFEMLGNFSFGIYFKQQAIQWAWELLTSKVWFAIPPERLWITVYHSDTESYTIWNQGIGVPQERIVRIGDNLGSPYASDNFWQMGDTGPCGPCSEIFYDHGSSMAGGPPGSVDADGDRFVEIWNIVFMQFSRLKDGTLQPLPTPCVDTGMGLERIAAVLQGVCSNYDTDLFAALIDAIAAKTQTTDTTQPAVRIIADHLRAAAFLIADGIEPSHEGRGYVLRRIIRRAIRYGQKLSTEPFLYQLVEPLIVIMGEAAQNVAEQKTVIIQQLHTEEQQFTQTLQHCSELLVNQLATLQGNQLSGEAAFKLYDTYGLPLDLTIEICREHNVSVDIDGFEQAMNAQRDRAKQASQFDMGSNLDIQVDSPSEFQGYECLQLCATVTALWYQGQAVNSISAGEEAIVFLQKTPFYAASGGQVGDQGELIGPHQSLFTVKDTHRYHEAIGHHGYLFQGKLLVGDTLEARVDEKKRQATALNHSATHLLHAALRQQFGEQVRQKGSLVNDRLLRFDFSYPHALSLEQQQQIEQKVNYFIRQNQPIQTTVMPLLQAKSLGALAFFEDKYGEQVRVLTMGDFSTELCGGTHATRTGDIGLFHIITESGIASGVRRIEAVTSELALQQWQQHQQQLIQIGCLVKESNNQKLVTKIQVLLQSQQQLKKQLQQLQENLALQCVNNLINNAIILKDASVIIDFIKGGEVNLLKFMVNELKQRLGSAIILLATVVKGRAHFIAGITHNLTSRITAPDLLNYMTQQLGGKGGGRAELAQAATDNVGRAHNALASVTDWLNTKL